jgi:hypothetical protein
MLVILGYYSNDLILKNQVVLFKKLSNIEDKMNGRTRSAPYTSYITEMEKRA